MSADGGSELISSVLEVNTWKWVAEYPVFEDALDEWKIELSSNKTENDGIVEICKCLEDIQMH